MAVSNKYEVHTICVFFEICLGCLHTRKQDLYKELVFIWLCKQYVDKYSKVQIIIDPKIETDLHA